MVLHSYLHNKYVIRRAQFGIQSTPSTENVFAENNHPDLHSNARTPSSNATSSRGSILSIPHEEASVTVEAENGSSWPGTNFKKTPVIVNRQAMRVSSSRNRKIVEISQNENETVNKHSLFLPMKVLNSSHPSKYHSSHKIVINMNKSEKLDVPINARLVCSSSMNYSGRSLSPKRLNTQCSQINPPIKDEYLKMTPRSNSCSHSKDHSSSHGNDPYLKESKTYLSRNRHSAVSSYYIKDNFRENYKQSNTVFDQQIANRLTNHHSFNQGGLPVHGKSMAASNYPKLMPPIKACKRNSYNGLQLVGNCSFSKMDENFTSQNHLNYRKHKIYPQQKNVNRAMSSNNLNLNRTNTECDINSGPHLIPHKINQHCISKTVGTKANNLQRRIDFNEDTSHIIKGNNFQNQEISSAYVMDAKKKDEILRKKHEISKSMYDLRHKEIYILPQTKSSHKNYLQNDRLPNISNSFTIMQEDNSKSDIRHLNKHTLKAFNEDSTVDCINEALNELENALGSFDLSQTNKNKAFVDNEEVSLVTKEIRKQDHSMLKFAVDWHTIGNADLIDLHNKNDQLEENSHGQIDCSETQINNYFGTRTMESYESSSENLSIELN